MANGTMEPKILAAKMGISPKRLRAMLRAEHPRPMEEKAKRWAIPTTLAKEIQKEYKAKKVEKEIKKQAEIQKELTGEEGEEPEEE